MIKSLLITIAVLLAVPNFIDTDINERLAYNKIERYHPALISINSIDKLEKYKRASIAYLLGDSTAIFPEGTCKPPGPLVLLS